jgi:hypothetical protein
VGCWRCAALLTARPLPTPRRAASRAARRVDHAVSIDAVGAQRDVLADAPAEQERLLEHDAHAPAQRLEVEARHVLAVAELARDPQADRVDADAPGVVAPFAHEGRWWMGEVLGRLPATLDARTREEVQRALFRRFLDEKREAARVQWHWL